MKFNEINLNEKTLRAIDEIGFVEMSPIQEKSIPHALEGSDIVGQAQTGTGKTAAFVIPILEKLVKNPKGIRHLIVAPTRELALQIVEEFKKIGKYHNFRIASIVGGMDFKKQINMLKEKPQVIVGTPGRLIDHINRKRINFVDLETFAIDEVDEMFKNGFKEEIDEIVSNLPDDKQTLLFSATISPNVKRIVQETCKDAVYVTVSKGKNVNKNVKQSYTIVKENDKFKTLLNYLSMHKREATIIFGRTKRRAEELGDALQKSGFNADAIHGDLNQRERNRVMKKFKDGTIDILVATDVAARGIDVQNITHVYNFDLPQETEFYTHRIGRTGRANKDGVAISFVRDVEIPHVERIMKETNAEIKEAPKPTRHDAIQANHSKIFSDVEKLVDSSTTTDKKMIKIISECFDKRELARVIIDLVGSQSLHSDIKLTGEPPVRVRRIQPTRNDRRRRSRGRRRKTVHRR